MNKTTPRHVRPKRGRWRWLRFLEYAFSREITDGRDKSGEVGEFEKFDKLEAKIEAKIAATAGHTKRWVTRRDVWTAILSGLVAGVVLLTFQNIIDNSRFRQSIMVENLRYVRELSHPGSQYRPFSSMDLSGQVLNGLIVDNADLRGADLSGAEMFDISARGARFEGTNLDEAVISSSNFTEAIFDDVSAYVKIRDSNFTGATFRPRKLGFGQNINSGKRGIINSDFTGAHLEGANMGSWIIVRTSLRAAHMENTVWGATQISLSDLRGANFTGATVKSKNFDRICYDDSTVWPTGFDPPPNTSEYCGEPKKDTWSTRPAPWRLGPVDR